MPEKANQKHLPGITVNHNMPDYSKSPFAIKMAEKARATIAKYGLPKEDKLKKDK
jgi:hypothetical protein